MKIYSEGIVINSAPGKIYIVAGLLDGKPYTRKIQDAKPDDILKYYKEHSRRFKGAGIKGIKIFKESDWKDAFDYSENLYNEMENHALKANNILSYIKSELHDASDEVKRSFNSIVKYFTYESHGIDDFMLWKSVSITDKNTGTSITLYSNPDMGFMYVQHEPTKEQSNVLNLMHLKWHKEKVQVGMSETGKPETKDYFIIDGNPSIFNTNLKSHNVGRLEIHAVPDYKCLEYLKKEGFNVSSVKQFDNDSYAAVFIGSGNKGSLKILPKDEWLELYRIAGREVHLIKEGSERAKLLLELESYRKSHNIQSSDIVEKNVMKELEDYRKSKNK
jgi:hypothetical protein